MTLKTAEIKNDGWANALTGLGKLGTDKTRANYYNSFRIFDDNELTNMYIGEGLGKEIIDEPADDMTRTWVTIHDDYDKKICDELERLKVQPKINLALKYARLYRGALILIIPKGATSNNLEKPMPKNISGIESLRVYSAARIFLTTADIVNKPNSPYFEDIEVFPITLRNGHIIRVHASRCLLFKGEPCPDYSSALDLKYRYWGLSALQSVWERLANLGSVEQSIANLMMEAVIGKYKLSNLAQILNENSPDSLSKLYTRMEVINASKSIINSVLLAENEDYTRDAANLSGIPEILDRMMVMLSAVCNIPVTKLFGRAPAGQNATGESDIRNYYDNIAAAQKNTLQDPIQDLINMISNYITPNQQHTFNFNPLWEPSEKEKTEVNKMKAEIDQIYIQNAVYTPEEVTERLEGDNV